MFTTGFPFYMTQVGIASTRWGLGCARLVGTPEVVVLVNSEVYLGYHDS